MLTAVGWTKLKLLCDHVTETNCHQLLKIAAKVNVEELKRILKHEPPLPNGRCIVLYFSGMEYALFKKAILAHGGGKKGQGLVNKEAALIAALSAAHQPKESTP